MTLKWAERLTKVEALAPCHSSLWNMLRRLKSNKIYLVVSVPVHFQRITHSSWNGRCSGYCSKFDCFRAVGGRWCIQGGGAELTSGLRF